MTGFFFILKLSIMDEYLVYQKNHLEITTQFIL